VFPHSRLVEDPAAVQATVQQRPKPHRSVNLMPDWFVQAAQIVLQRYGSNTERLWSDQPTAIELRRRLEEFPGIGQKKAAMVVEIPGPGSSQAAAAGLPQDRAGRAGRGRSHGRRRLGLIPRKAWRSGSPRLGHWAPVMPPPPREESQLLRLPLNAACARLQFTQEPDNRKLERHPRCLRVRHERSLADKPRPNYARSADEFIGAGKGYLHGLPIDHTQAQLSVSIG
jgi:hypothetical protein